ncbi:MAG: LamG domain-containing protein [Planctomycetota bacterium]|nr:LamG domain-containing protein [Planctomycetota bacterium]
MRTTWMVGVLGLVSMAILAAGGCGEPASKAGGVHPGGAAPLAAGDLKGCWTFDEGSGETVKNAAGLNNGKLMGGLGWTEGKRGKAVAFNGKGYVLVESAAYLNAPQYTFAAWVKLKDTSDYQYIVWRGGPEFPEPKESRSLDVWVTNAGTLSGILDYQKAGGDRAQISGSAKVADNQWHLVACVYSGKALRFYVDGKKDAEVELAGPLAKSEFPLWIGARPGEVAATGVIDEVRFFDRALTAEEVAALK